MDTSTDLMAGPAAEPAAVAVRVAGGRLCVELQDGREIAAPLDWFPRLACADAHALADYRLIGQGTGIAWDALDEHVSVLGLLGLPD